MDEKIKSLWNNNRILFFILLPLVIILFLGFVFRDLVLALLIGSARKTSEEAKKNDEELKAKQNAANNQANELKAKSDQIEEKINERKEEEVSEDWHKKS